MPDVSAFDEPMPDPLPPGVPLPYAVTRFRAWVTLALGVPMIFMGGVFLTGLDEHGSRRELVDEQQVLDYTAPYLGGAFTVTGLALIVTIVRYRRMVDVAHSFAASAWFGYLIVAAIGFLDDPPQNTVILIITTASLSVTHFGMAMAWSGSSTEKATRQERT